MSLPGGSKIQEKDLLPIYTAEYTSLRTEIIARITAQGQAASHVLVMLGAVIAAVVATFNADEPSKGLEWILISAAILLPIGAVSLFSSFAEHDVMIGAIGSFIYYDRRKRLQELTHDDAVLGSVFDFRYIARSTRATHGKFGLTRHVLFCLPLALSVVLWGFWTHRFEMRLTSEFENGPTLIAVLLGVSHGYAVLMFLMAFRWRREQDADQERRFREHYLVRSLRNRVVLQRAVDEVAVLTTKRSELVKRRTARQKHSSLTSFTRLQLRTRSFKDKRLALKKARESTKKFTIIPLAGYGIVCEALCRRDYKLAPKLKNEVRKIQQRPNKRYWLGQVPVALPWTPDRSTGASADNENALWTRKLNTGNGEYFLVYRIHQEFIFLLQIKGPEAR